MFALFPPVSTSRSIPMSFRERVRDLRLFVYLIVITFLSSLHLNEALKDEDIKKCHREVVSFQFLEQSGWSVEAWPWLFAVEEPAGDLVWPLQMLLGFSIQNKGKSCLQAAPFPSV